MNTFVSSLPAGSTFQSGDRAVPVTASTHTQHQLELGLELPFCKCGGNDESRSFSPVIHLAEHGERKVHRGCILD